MVVVVTGSSSGIGRTTAEHLVAKGYRVYGFSRTPGKPGSGFTFIKTDVTETDTVEKSLGEILQKERQIDVLINAAGMGVSGSVEATPAQDSRDQMEVNFWGTVNMCRAVLPAMRKAKQGVIINISSVGGLIGLPYQGYYSASKFAIEGITEAMRTEVAPFGIRAYLIEPGDFYTGFTANRRKTHDEPADYAIQNEKTLEIIEKDETGGRDPVMIARKIEKLIRKKPRGFRYVVSDPLEKIAPFAKRIMPYSLFEKLIAGHYGIQRKHGKQRLPDKK